MARATTKKSNTRRTRAATSSKQPAVEKRAASLPKTVPKAIQPARTAFPNSWQLLVRTWRFWRQHGRVLIVYLLVLAGLNLLLVHNFGTDIATLKSQVQQATGGNAPAGSLTTYALFVGSSGSSAQGAAAVYQYLLLVIASLSFIWLLRQLLSDKAGLRLRVRDAFYQGMYPLIPFVLVLLVLTLELIPLILGTFIYTVIVQNGIAVGAVQAIIWLLVLLAGAITSLWLLAGSLFGIYIVTLPNMTPVLALRNARQLSRGQRSNIIRKSLFLMALFLLVSAVVLVPVIAIAPVLAGVALFALGVLALPAAHSYFYMMYRELLS
jgi:hypothetical protein